MGKDGVGAGRIRRREDRVEIPHKHRGDGAGGDRRFKGGKKFLPLPAQGIPRWCMQVDKAKSPTGEELGMTGSQVHRRRRWYARQGGDDPTLGTAKEKLIPTGGGQANQRGRGSNFLQEAKVGAMLAKEGGQAAEIVSLGGVKGEDGEEGASLLPIIPVAPSLPRHPDWSQKCARTAA
jgi:hypothetical protein